MCDFHDIDLVVAEDDDVFRGLLATHFAALGSTVRTAEDGAAALDLCERRAPDALVLDVGFSGAPSGVEVCAALRALAAPRPYVLMVTGRRDDVDVLVGFGAGADGYVMKPCRPAVVAAHLAAGLRATRPRGKPAARARLDLSGHRLVVQGRQVELTRIERGILSALRSAPGGLLARDALLDAVWQSRCEAWSRNVDSHVARLRKKLRRVGIVEDVVETVHGVGYRLAEAYR